MKQISKPVIFFDGFCGTCNFYVDLLLQIDRHEALIFAPIQGETAAALISEELRSNLSTIVFYNPTGEIYTKSMAVWQTFKLLPWPWRIISFARVIPLFISDFFYVLVARYRYLLGGRRTTCRLPEEGERSRFLM